MENLLSSGSVHSFSLLILDFVQQPCQTSPANRITALVWTNEMIVSKNQLQDGATVLYILPVCQWVKE